MNITSQLNTRTTPENDYEQTRFNYAGSPQEKNRLIMKINPEHKSNF